MGEESDPWVGKTVGGKYRVVESLGKGGMASVYLALQESIGREVAIKVMRAECLTDPDLRKRFEHEARATSEVTHPNLVVMHDYGVEGDVPYLVLERLRGKTLKEELQERGPLPWKEAVDIVRQAAAGLAASHAQQILHRDIKTANIFLVDEAHGRSVKLLDFGIAKLLGRDLTSATREGTVPGTIGVMAPERLTGAGDDMRSDLYSLGVVLFETLTGKQPFSSPNLADLIAMHVHSDPPKPSSTVKDIPPAVDKIVRELLAKKPQQRPTAQTLVTRLAELTGHKDAADGLVASEETESMPPSPAPPPIPPHTDDTLALPLPTDLPPEKPTFPSTWFIAALAIVVIVATIVVILRS